MKISYNWLKTFTLIEISIPDLASRLTMAGIEVEDITYVNNKTDAILELGITPNRADCLSVLGIAREVSAITESDISLPDFSIVEEGGLVEDSMSVSVNETDRCPRYCARMLSGVSVGPSPQWLQDRLMEIDIKPINNVVDATNFVLMELGHPLHAFDYNKIEGKKIVVRMAKRGERFVSLDKTTYELTEEVLVIADEKKPVALAGIVGGANSEVDEQTTNVLLEAAFFDPIQIRKTAKKFGVHTESSHRFERGVDHEGTVRAIDRVAFLIQQIAGGKIARGRIDTYPFPIHAHTVSLRISRVNRILGIDLARPVIENCLQRLSLRPSASSSKNADIIDVIVPSFRKDITREVDLIEEAARLHGYDTIPSEVPLAHITSHTIDLFAVIEKKIKDTLSMKGVHEVINYSFVSETLFQDIGVFDAPATRIKNPLTQEWGVMRTTLIPGVLQTISYNRKKGNRDSSLFEIGTVFFSDKEEKMLVCAITQQRNNSLWEEKGEKRTFFDLKGVLEVVLASCKVEEYVLSPEDHPLFAAGGTANIRSRGMHLGNMGEVSSRVCDRFDIDDRIFFFEIRLEPIQACRRKGVSFSPLPKYPGLLRDVAFIVDKKVTSTDILNAIDEDRSSLLQEVSLFDYYEGKPIPPDKKNLAYSLTYRADDRTLTEEEVDTVHDKTIRRLREKLGITFRD